MASGILKMLATSTNFKILGGGGGGDPSPLPLYETLPQDKLNALGHSPLPLCTTAQLEQELEGRDEKISELRHALTMLDQDHDTLRADADAKDETIAQLRREIREQVSVEIN